MSGVQKEGTQKCGRRVQITRTKKGGIAYDVMQMGIQCEFDGLPGTDDLTIPEIAEVLCADRYSISHAISAIKKKTGYIVPYVKMKSGRRSE